MTRKSSVEGDSGFVIVLRAHDHIWRSPIPLRERSTVAICSGDSSANIPWAEGIQEKFVKTERPPLAWIKKTFVEEADGEEFVAVAVDNHN